MASPYAQLEEAAARWRERGWPAPDVLVVSGSGLAVELGSAVEGPHPLQELLPFPVQALPGHHHQFELLKPREDRTVLYCRGRIHAYQGYDADQTVFVTRLAALLGAKVMVMTNAAGGIKAAYDPGDLVAIEDHLNLSGRNPLRGEPPAEWGPRFPDMVGAYDPALRARLASHAEALGIKLQSGVYAGLAGPSFETPAEVRMLQTLGADLAGMSTVLEVIAARHLGVRCAAVSLVANAAAGVSPDPLTHEEVLEAGEQAAGSVRKLLTALLRGELV